MNSIIANPKTEAETQAVLAFLESMNIDVEIYEKPSKEQILNNIEEGAKDVKSYLEGKTKLQDAFELYNEL